MNEYPLNFFLVFRLRKKSKFKLFNEFSTANIALAFIKTCVRFALLVFLLQRTYPRNFQFNKTFKVKFVYTAFASKHSVLRCLRDHLSCIFIQKKSVYALMMKFQVQLSRMLIYGTQFWVRTHLKNKFMQLWFQDNSL